MAFNLKNLEQMPRSTAGNNFKYVTDDDRYTVSQAGYFDLSSVTLNNPGNATINCLCPNHSFVAIVSSDGDCLVKLADRTYQYFTADTIADVTASGYFAGKNYSFDADESIKVQASDGPYEVQLVGGVASVVGGITPATVGWSQSTGDTTLVDDSPFLQKAADLALSLGVACDFGTSKNEYYLLNPLRLKSGHTIKCSGAKFWRNVMFNGGSEAPGATFRNDDQVGGNSNITLLGYFVFGDKNDGTVGKTSHGKHIGLINADDFSYEKVRFDETYTFSTSIDGDNIHLGSTVLNHQVGAGAGHDGIHIRGGKNGYIGPVTGVSGDDCVAFTDEGDGNGSDMDSWTVASINATSRTAALFKVFADASATFSITNIKVGNICGVAGDNGKAIKIENLTGTKSLISDIEYCGQFLDCSLNDDNGISVQNCQSITFSGFKVSDSRGAAVRITDSDDVTMSNISVADCKHDRNIFIDGCSNVKIIGGKDYNARGYGTIISGSTNVTVNGRTVGTFGSSAYRNWYESNAVTTGDRRINSGNVYEAATDGATGSTGPTHTSGTVSDGGVDWLYIGAFSNWAATTAYAVGDIVARQGRIYGCTVAGTTGSTAPTHKTGTAADGTVTWEALIVYSGIRIFDSARCKVTSNDIERGGGLSIGEYGTSNKNIITGNNIPVGDIDTVGGGTIDDNNVT